MTHIDPIVHPHDNVPWPTWLIPVSGALGDFWEVLMLTSAYVAPRIDLVCNTTDDEGLVNDPNSSTSPVG
eukprot:m.780804 g.780804  ORF g.780804 m.780804 type:complete len:70 (+) comp23285_c1_seq1:526-735(+)